ncbi:AAA family ATPase [Vandammella animalimorsus]|uniref:AAA family ATPase n=1 Tax=Vandammella animalimorsus TaxID=2029117 RepID=A0A3M6R7R0_9BURK|nr:ATP-binding protein [Vandammella animalimorsus]RMX10819.1 AAA family ATPase [Vandammella animalimorsus]
MKKITHITLEHFTAFSKLDLSFSPGVNVVIGANGTGKTHLLKVLYAAAEITTGEDRDKGFARKLLGVFNPYEARMTRLIHRQQGLPAAEIVVCRDDCIKLKLMIDSKKSNVKDVQTIGESKWQEMELESAYIPVKEMLAHAPGFLATAAKREIAFEEVYVDIVKKAFLPRLKGATDNIRRKLLEPLQRTINGKVTTKGEHFFLKNSQGELEFTLLAEGMRKLALVWLLIQNGTLQRGSLLFWDEPEANLNPALMGQMVEIILELQRQGVQVFLTTHNYVLLKELDLRSQKQDAIRYISLYRAPAAANAIVAHASDNYIGMDPNAIAETFSSLYDRELLRSLGGLAK